MISDISGRKIRAEKIIMNHRVLNAHQQILIGDVVFGYHHQAEEDLAIYFLVNYKLLTPVGALLFYTTIYFLGYFAIHGLNLIAGRILINRRIAGLIGVFFMAALHGYKIINSLPPAGQDIDATYALAYYIIFPVSVIVGVFLYLMWQEKKDHNSL